MRLELFSGSTARNRGGGVKARKQDFRTENGPPRFPTLPKLATRRSLPSLCKGLRQPPRLLAVLPFFRCQQLNRRKTNLHKQLLNNRARESMSLTVASFCSP